jgi:hypothetical protein
MHCCLSGAFCFWEALLFIPSQQKLAFYQYIDSLRGITTYFSDYFLCAAPFSPSQSSSHYSDGIVQPPQHSLLNQYRISKHSCTTEAEERPIKSRSGKVQYRAPSPHSAYGYFLQEKTFSAWEKFTSWWIALTFLLILVTPESGFRGVGGLGPITLLAFLTKELVVWFSVIGYSIFSSILIVYKFFKLKKSGAGE